MGGAVLFAAACGPGGPGSDAGTVVVVPADGCYAFTPLPDSAYTIASDTDWPREVRWEDRRADQDYPYSFRADALDSDWGSLASPLGRGESLPPDSVVLTWGGDLYRLKVAADGSLSGVAVKVWGGEGDRMEIVGEVSGHATPCSR